MVLGARTTVVTDGTLGAEDSRAVGPDTLFEIGSVSKIYTALLGATAEADGRISLQDSPARFLPWLRGTPLAGVTLDQLGTYTAGEFPLQFPPSVTDETSMRDYFTTWRPTAPAGTTRRYANPSIGLFGLSAAAAYGMDYPVALRERVLTPLDLRDTYISIPDSAADRYAWGRTSDSPRVRLSPRPLDAEAYGVKTTPSDLAAFTAAFMNPTTPPAIRSAMQPRYEVSPMRQSLGWEGIASPATRKRVQDANAAGITGASRPVTPTGPEPSCLLNKTGSTKGFGTYVLLHPGSRTGVALLANRNIPIPDRIDAAFDILSAAVPNLSCSPQRTPR
ncbi:Beta-lactamase OS=Tsukamurella paurometabola (strain ATCC 8368 / DSM / CCUG 35730 / CIP 100753/ JCM 10117 / KCTC 9821 / NBRC 16120 / NCIMB 702349 / NCTC 13040) OX=521096 GN=Tpau_0388 PE=3 SV=1 [Tsukamurella paurometabola]|nr:Beta-lactamase precursor [Tsukamurella paurometabola]